MGCCSNHSDQNGNKKKAGKVDDRPPKTIIGKYLYNLGKRDLEKEKNGGKHKGDCC